MSVTSKAPPSTTGFVRSLGLFQATAINMSQIVGIGPFVTIPLMVGAFGGPQAVIGWIAGAVLALADGLIWAELGSSQPGAGGSYVYLREAFQYRTGRLMPFLFVWTAILFIPLIMSTGIQGFVQYLGYIWPSITPGQGDLVGVGAIVLIFLLLTRRTQAVGKLTGILWIVVMIAAAAVIVAAFTHFSAHRAFTYPPGAFSLTHGSFWVGFAAGLTIGIYDYLGYNTTAYMGAEIKEPGRVLPRSIIYSIFAIMGIYLLLQIGVLGAVDWHAMINSSNPASQFVGAVVLQNAWGDGPAKFFVALILVTALTSVFAGLLGGSRVPFDAAHDGVFFKPFGRLSARSGVPLLGVATVAVVTAAGFLFARHVDDTAAHPPLSTLIALLTTVMVIVQSMAQIAAVPVLRKRQAALRRPYKMLLYPVPLIIAFAGWATVYGWADKANPGVHPIEFSLAWVALGVVAFLGWAKLEKTWPFGPKDIHEQFLAAQEAAEAPVSAEAAADTAGEGAAG